MASQLTGRYRIMLLNDRGKYEQLAHYHYEIAGSRTRDLFIESWMSITYLLTCKLQFNYVKKTPDGDEDL